MPSLKIGSNRLRLMERSQLSDMKEIKDMKDIKEIKEASRKAFALKNRDNIKTNNAEATHGLSTERGKNFIASAMASPTSTAGTFNPAPNISILSRPSSQRQQTAYMSRRQSRTTKAWNKQTIAFPVADSGTVKDRKLSVGNKVGTILNYKRELGINDRATTRFREWTGLP